MEKDICCRQRKKKEVVYDDCIVEDSLSQGDWLIEEDPNVDYDLLRKLTNKKLLARRGTLKLDPNASHIERLVANTSCRKALQEDLSKYRQKILEGAQ
ncbi:hypothetical protein RB195_014632 [Necator americanus]|uniref:Uncharacterized protein n=1 Tax=Necator americanus TaxID=51031 RepID=A0ABR1E162_NECAM